MTPRGTIRFARGGLTLIELLVVIVIITILFGSILVATAGVRDRARVNATRTVLQLTQDAVEEFQREQKRRPTIVNARRGTPNPAPYATRYGEYPPDELEIFSLRGLPGAPGWQNSNNWSLAPSGAVVMPGPDAQKWGPMRYYTDADVTKNAVEHRNLSAMIVAIELLGDASAVYLSNIPERYRVAGVLDDRGDPALFIDRPPDLAQDPNGTWDSGDHQIRWIVDDWGVPLEYFAIRDYLPGESQTFTEERASTNHPLWRQASTFFVRSNGGKPLIMSYGPNGPDQRMKDVMEPEGASAANPAAVSMVGDYNDKTGEDAGKIDHPLNQDNVYLDADLTRKLAEGPGVKP